MKNTPIERHLIDETINEFQIVDFSKATIREVKAIASKAEAASGVEFIKMEMGVPGLPPSAVGVKAEIEALQNGIASLYPDINGLPELKKEASNFIKAFINVDLSPEGCVPVTGSMQGTFASFLTCKYDLRNNVLLSFLDQALDLVYTAEIREKEGGTYGVSCNGSLGKYPKEELVLQIVFQTDPAKKDKLSAVVVEQLHKMAKEGPSAEHMQKIKEYMLKKYKDAQKENGYWLNNMDEYLYTGVDNTKDYEKLVNSITAKEVQDFLAKLLKQNNEIQVIMTVPEENK